MSLIPFLFLISSILLAATFLIPAYPPHRTRSKRRKAAREDLIACEFEKVRKLR